MKDPNRPRAAHKLNLRDGDVVELVAWQDGRKDQAGVHWRFKETKLLRIGGIGSINVPSMLAKGERPLFRVISRADDAKPEPDESFTIHKRDKAYHLTFPAGSDVGTVTREKL